MNTPKSVVYFFITLSVTLPLPNFAAGLATPLDRAQQELREAKEHEIKALNDVATALRNKESSIKVSAYRNIAAAAKNRVTEAEQKIQALKNPPQGVSTLANPGVFALPTLHHQ